MKLFVRLAAAAAFALAAFAPSFAADLPPFYAAMNEPVVPFRISDDIYYVGAKDVTAFLIVTDGGLILTDGGFAQTAPQILGNIRSLGFDPKQVKILLNSHAHFDHAGGLAELKKTTGAAFYAAHGDAPVLESGGVKDFVDLGPLSRFAPVKIDKYLADGEELVLGRTTLTIHLTPGHTKGCTSWSMTTHIAGEPERVLFICSLTVLSNYNLLHMAAYPNIAADYADTIAKLRSLPCDVMLGAHGSFFHLQEKHKKLEAGDVEAFVDPAGCKAYLDGADAAYQAELVKEKAAP